VRVRAKDALRESCEECQRDEAGWPQRNGLKQTHVEV
jgi:hypothetical protein